MQARLTYGCADSPTGRLWQETQIFPAKRAAQEARLLSAILFVDELPEHDFRVGTDKPWLCIWSGQYFIEVELTEREKPLCMKT